MIRFLQKDNRVVKAMFVVIIAAASVSMVVYLIPGLTGQGAVSADTLRRGLPALVQPLDFEWRNHQPGAGDAAGAACSCSSAIRSMRRTR